jgi:hypothetical protein
MAPDVLSRREARPLRYRDADGHVQCDAVIDAAKLAGLEATGNLAHFRGFRQWEPATLTVDGDHPVAIGVDGEALVLDPRRGTRTFTAGRKADRARRRRASGGVLR